MCVLVDGLDPVTEDEVIKGELLDSRSGTFNLESEFTATPTGLGSPPSFRSAAARGRGVVLG